MKGYAIIKAGEHGWIDVDEPVAGPLDAICKPLAAQKPTLEGIKEFCTDKIILDATVPLETAIGGKPFSSLT